MLGRGIGAGLRQRRVLVNRGDVNNAPAAALGNHVPRRNLRAEQRPLNVNGKGGPPVVERDVKKRRFRHSPGVVHQDVNAPQPLNQRFQGLYPLRQAAEIELNGLRLMPQGGHLARGALGPLFIAVPGDAQRVALTRQLQGALLTNTGI